MPDALTKEQLEILRRLRDGRELASDPKISNLGREISFLNGLQLLSINPQLEIELSDFGVRYLAAAEAELENPNEGSIPRAK